MIHFLFQSINCSVMIEEELMQKIIASSSDIVDRREVEEQLKLLQELVPEWISEKLASSGDLLLCIKKTPSPESIRKTLITLINGGKVKEWSTIHLQIIAWNLSNLKHTFLMHLSPMRQRELLEFRTHPNTHLCAPTTGVVYLPCWQGTSPRNPLSREVPEAQSI